MTFTHRVQRTIDEVVFRAKSREVVFQDVILVLVGCLELI